MKKKESKYNIVFNKDARSILENVPPDTLVSSTITSPPYFDMKDYQSDNQIGYGQTYIDYLKDLKKIFKDVYKITKDDGSLWIIIDTFKRDNQVVTLPFDLANNLKEIGWLLQDIIIWKKDKTLPWSNNGFMQRKFEYILFFTKTNSFKYNKDKVRLYDTEQLKKWWIKYPERYNPKGKALDEVWEFPIPIQGSWGDKYIRHFCPLPKDMVATMIQLSSDEGDMIFDPFAGSGTVLAQSAYMKRKYMGFELNPSYIQMFENYLNATLQSGIKEYESIGKTNNQNEFEKNILNLRSLKYAKNLITKIQDELEYSNFKIYVKIVGESQVKNKLIKVEYTFLGDINKVKTIAYLNEKISKKPFSNFGIEPIFKFSKKNINNLKGYAYTETNTYSFIETVDLNTNKVRIISPICVNLNERDYQ